MKRGYTLVELLIVIVIIGILTTIAFVGFGKIQADARDKERASNATIISEALEKYYEKNGEYPSVPAVTNTNISQVKTLLGIVDSDVLVMPKSAAGTVTSITATADPPVVDKLAYNGESNSAENDQCQNNASGGCDQFKLQWLNENGEPGEIDSRHGGRDATGALLPPTDPTMTASLSGGSVVGTVTHAIQPACAVGSVSYKIITSTAPISDPDWSGVTPQATNTKSVSSPVSGTTYYFYALASCKSGTSGEAINSNVAEDKLYFSLTTMTAAWSGTNAVGTISTSAPPICGAGLTAKYFIEYKIDTVAPSSGAWTIGQNWTTTNYYTIANANTSNPRMFSFRGKVRCDNTSTGTLGTESGVTNTDFVISAPAAPVLSNTSTTSTTTWTWPDVACPVGTTVVYKGTWTGNYNAYPAMTSTIASGKQQTSSSQGFTYGLKATASCGAESPRILASISNDSTYLRKITTVPFRSAKAATRTYRPTGGAGSTIYVVARVDTLQPNSGNSYVACPAGLIRVIGWQTSKNGASWNPGGNAGYSLYNTTTQTDSGSTKDEQSWSYNTNKYFYYASDLNDNDVLEARFLVRCKNATANTYSPAASSTYPYDDRIGNLQVTNGSNGQYHVLCDISGSAGQSIKRPVWCTSGYTAGGDSTDQCHMEDPNDSINGTHHGCFSKLISQDNYAWAFYAGPPPNVNDPSNAPSDGQSGYDAPDTWGKME